MQAIAVFFFSFMQNLGALECQQGQPLNENDCDHQENQYFCAGARTYRSLPKRAPRCHIDRPVAARGAFGVGQAVAIGHFLLANGTVHVRVAVILAVPGIGEQ